jgi:hypothetical protein
MTGPAGMGMHDPLKALIDDKQVMWRTYAVPSARVMFVQVHKNACTSLKWMMAAIAGEDGFRPSLDASASTSEYDDIHVRSQWTKSPRLDQMRPELRAQIHPDNGWFVFAVTRDPRSRLFSAWQSKLLLENPGYTRYLKARWYPRHPLDAGTVVEDFAKFVDLLEHAAPDHRIRRDPHFGDQVDLLYSDVVTYTEIYDTRELGRLRTDIERHLASVGWSGELRLPKLNDTPLRVNARPFADGIRERIEKIFARDFDRFGERWDFGRIQAGPEWTDADLRAAELAAGYGRRLGYLRSQALTFRAQADAERQRADTLERQLRSMSAPPRRALHRRVARRVKISLERARSR